MATRSYNKIMATIRTACVYRIFSLWYSYVCHTSTGNHRLAIRSQTNLCRDKDLTTSMRTVYDAMLISYDCPREYGEMAK